MRAHQISCPQGNTVFPMDYLNAQWSIQCVPVGGATYSVQYTNDDPNDTEGQGVVPTWFAFPASLTGATTAQFFPGFTVQVTQQPIRAIRVQVSVSGTVNLTVVQESGQS